ncbi:helix-turn-helix domain-containing protein [Streptomyces sp. IBSBF 2435]|uniref:helix-turn-helix domain-containing protein n=1 Tax=Streptomyces sp. IBSBF 2435 TaxID=2903531 RepID=UPI002FDC3DAA
MDTLYDTATVHPPDRYEYYRAESAAELAPVTVHGRPPGQLRAVMSVAKISDFEIESHTFAADREISVRRTERLIGVSDPECYRVVTALTPGIRVKHAGHTVDLRARDIALYDSSQPWETTNPTGLIQTAMLTFPRALVPVDYAAVRPLVGSVTPKNVPGRSALAQFLIGLTEPAGLEVPALAEVLYECVVGLIRQRLGEPGGITPQTHRLLQRTHISGIIRRNLGDPALGPEEIATAANLSTRYLYSLFQDAELTPMRFPKNLRLQEARRRLEDPALASLPICDVMSAVGYRRSDQFARDFRQMFGVSPKDHRQLSCGQRTS